MLDDSSSFFMLQFYWMKNEERRKFRGNSNLNTSICNLEKKEAMPLLSLVSTACHLVIFEGVGDTVCAEGRENLDSSIEKFTAVIERIKVRCLFIRKISVVCWSRFVVD